jgi:hypothetical protein
MPQLFRQVIQHFFNRADQNVNFYRFHQMNGEASSFSGVSAWPKPNRRRKVIAMELRPDWFDENQTNVP